MKRIFSILLLGTLSMLFAENFSGASQAWFLDPFAIALAFFLYLGHCLFFYWIAYKKNKTSLLQLYFLGVLFGLYESWITKVLWSGYMEVNTGPGMGTFLGVGLAEFPVLAYLWHPIFAFILPILTFEIITGNVLVTHEKALTKTKKKSIFILIVILFVSTFVANGNEFDLGSVWLSLGGTYLLIFLFTLISKGKDLSNFHFNKIGFIFICIYLVGLYLWGITNLFPERMPQTILPYLTIIVTYIIGIILFRKTKTNSVELVPRTDSLYSKNDLFGYAILMFVLASGACFVPDVALIFLSVSYFGMILLGFGLFIKNVIQVFRNQKHEEILVVEAEQ